VTERRSPAGPDTPVDLKDPALAGFLAWLIPGLGHLYQQRYGKAVLFFVCIMGTFSYGLYLGAGRVVYASWREGDKRLPYFCQLGVGLPALPALIQAYRVRHGHRPLLGGFMAPPPLHENEGPADEPTLGEMIKTLHGFFELGTVYTMIAGLINILAIYDACAGPVLAKQDKGKKEDDQEGSKHTEAETAATTG
jgi:hypothetical protein